MLGEVPVPASAPAPAKEKQKEVQFDRVEENFRFGT